MQEKSISEIPAEAWQSLIASMSGTNPAIDAMLVQEFSKRHQIPPDSVMAYLRAHCHPAPQSKTEGSLVLSSALMPPPPTGPDGTKISVWLRLGGSGPCSDLAIARGLFYDPRNRMASLTAVADVDAAALARRGPPRGGELRQAAGAIARVSACHCGAGAAGFSEGLSQSGPYSQ